MINVSILILLCVISAFFGIRRRPLFLFNLWWSFWVVISKLNILNFFTVSESTYSLISSSLVIFNLFFILSASLSIVPFKFSVGGGYSQLKHVGLALSIGHFIITLILFAHLLGLIDFDFSKYWKARYFYYNIPLPGSGEGISLFPSSLFAGLYQIYSSILMLFFLIFLSKNYQKGIFFILVCISMFCILTTGRDIIIYLFVLLIFSYKTNALLKNYKLILFLIIILSVISLYRSDGALMVIYAAISYFTGSIVYLDILLQGYQEPLTGYYLGEVVASQLAPSVYKFFGIISGQSSISPFLSIGKELMEYTQVSDDSPFYNYYNALPTWYYFFFRDFGYFGSYIYLAIIGAILGVMYNMLSSRLYEHVVLMSFIEVCLLWSIFKPMLFEFGTIITIVLYFVYLGKYVRTNSNYSL